MRNHILLILFIIAFLPVKGTAQTSLKDADITGLWKGTLYNDTTRQFYKYEIGISKEKGKLSGFSHTFFIGDDKEFYGVKKVKIRIVDDKLIVEDAGLIANNYPVPPDKGVRQLNVLTLEIKDSIMILTGPFETNRTRAYSSLTGKIHLQRKNDFWQSALVPHLQELGFSNDLSFVKEETEKKLLQKEAVEKNNSIAIQKNEIAQAEPKKEAVAKEIASHKPETKEEKGTVVKPAESKKETQSAATEIAVNNNDAKKEKPTEKKSVEVKEAAAPSKQETTNPGLAIASAKEKKEANSNSSISNQSVKSNAPAAEVAIRKNIIQQTVYFSSDSLQLSLYDNGEVDGDTVSVLMNGKIIMAKERLSTNAVRKTIYTEPNTDSIELVMYAENLGTIAPNTGLLVVHDGKNLYEIRFSGDLQKNASIILRRRKN